MKKLLSISIAFIYLAISTGLVLQIHFCMGKEVGASIQFSETEDRACDKCGMDSKKGNCCHDELKVLRVDDSHQKSVIDLEIMAPAAPALDYNFLSPRLNLEEDAGPAVILRASPPDKSSILQLQCAFRI